MVVCPMFAIHYGSWLNSGSNQNSFGKRSIGPRVSQGAAGADKSTVHGNKGNKCNKVILSYVAWQSKVTEAIRLSN